MLRLPDGNLRLPLEERTLQYHVSFILKCPFGGWWAQRKKDMTENKGNDNTETNPVNDIHIVPQYNKNYCKYCGKELQADAIFCSMCGRPQGNVPIHHPAVQIVQHPVYGQPYITSAYQQPQPTMASVSNDSSTTVVVEGSRSNSMGVAGFIIALIGLIFCWVPGVNFILWFLGLVFSFVGLFKAPRGMAITGLVLSLIVIFAIITIMGSIAAFFNSL